MTNAGVISLVFVVNKMFRVLVYMPDDAFNLGVFGVARDYNAAAFRRCGFFGDDAVNLRDMRTG
jgi:hypothetical protein